MGIIEFILMNFKFSVGLFFVVFVVLWLGARPWEKGDRR